MNKELFDSMQKQMTPSPEVRAALTEQLTQSAKKRPVPWKKYGVIAACAVLAVGVLGASQYPSWEHILQNFRPSILETKLHSYVTAEDADVYTTENGTVYDLGLGSGGENDSLGVIDRNEETYTGDILDHTQSHNTGDLPGGAYVGDVSTQEEAIQAYDKLAPFTRSHPDWYGGAYIDNTGTLVVCLVESQDPGDKSLELQVLEWTGSDRIAFTDVKYSLAHLLDLQEKICDALYYDLGLGFSCGTNEELNRLELTLPEVTDEALALLAKLDPDDDAILVRVGRRVSSVDIAADEPSVIPEGEEPVSHDIMPGGVTVPEGEDPKAPIAEEPWYDGARYDLEQLPEELPQQKLPAFGVDTAPEEDTAASSFPQE